MRLDASALNKFDDLADIRFSSNPDGARARIVTRSVSRGPERAFVDSRKDVPSREFSICAVKFRDDPQFAIGIAEAVALAVRYFFDIFSSYFECLGGGGAGFSALAAERTSSFVNTAKRNGCNSRK
jgi:hypothetical protein